MSTLHLLLHSLLLLLLAIRALASLLLLIGITLIFTGR